MIRYKVVELTSVTDADLETTLNTWTSQGWVLDDIKFVVRDGQRRPGMAFVLFTRGDVEGNSSALEAHQTSDQS